MLTIGLVFYFLAGLSTFLYFMIKDVLAYKKNNNLNSFHEYDWRLFLLTVFTWPYFIISELRYLVHGIIKWLKK